MASKFQIFCFKSILFAVFTIPETGAAYFSVNEINVASSLIRNLYIKRCIVIVNMPKPTDFTSREVKEIIGNDLCLISVVDFLRLGKILETEKIPTYKTAIIVKVDDLSEFSVPLYDYTLAVYTLIFFFVPTRSNVREIEELYVPYNASFYLIEKINKNRFEISETYNTDSFKSLDADNYESEKRITKRIGYWCSNKGLKIEEPCYFKRRMNLDGTMLTVGVPDPQKEVEEERAVSGFGVFFPELNADWPKPNDNIVCYWPNVFFASYWLDSWNF